ncbi:TPA: phage integrase family protein [Citrobacter amalonaticus]|nr:tyrosine-type recombinase/integrase [Citrobacter amalonaticus]HAU4370193.1 phage integrase family protein [Citrobacter amalonaticus]
MLLFIIEKNQRTDWHGFKIRNNGLVTWVNPEDSNSFRAIGVPLNDAACKQARWAGWLIQSGVPLSVFQELVGWVSIELVRRYAHHAPNHLT